MGYGWLSLNTLLNVLQLIAQCRLVQRPDIQQFQIDFIRFEGVAFRFEALPFASSSALRSRSYP